MNYLRLMCVCAHISVACCIAADKGGSAKHDLTNKVTLSLPEGVTIQRQRSVEDFSLFTVQNQTNVILGIYVGNHPGFPAMKGAGKVSIGTVNQMTTKSVTQHNENGTVSREVLFHLQETSGWPQRVHCFYNNLNTQEAEQADKIISTIRRR